MSFDNFRTPMKNRLHSLVLGQNGGFEASPGRKITVPASPSLERLGYGTGVSVYLMERAPISGGGYRSPWAVKKVAKRFANQEHQDFSKRLLEEANILKKLEHPNIIGFRTLTKSVDGTWCLAMEKAENCLMDLIEQRLDSRAGPFPPHQIKCVGIDIANALEYLHTEKLLMHGDMKSGNILIFGDFKVAKLCDFGVAMALKEANGQAKPDQFYIGTQAWSAPEVIDMDGSFENDEAVITCKADIFSYGLTIWEMLSLCVPHADLLQDEEEDEEDDEKSYGSDCPDLAYQEALGTRPPLPDLPEVPDYSTAIAVFIATTEYDPEKRPLASEVMNIWNLSN